MTHQIIEELSDKLEADMRRFSEYTEAHHVLFCALHRPMLHAMVTLAHEKQLPSKDFVAPLGWVVACMIQSFLTGCIDKDDGPTAIEITEEIMEAIDGNIVNMVIGYFRNVVPKQDIN